MDPGRTEKVPARRWFFPPRTLNQLMTMVALSGLAMAAIVPRAGVTPAPPRRFPPAPLWYSNVPLPQPAQPWTPDSRFVITAPEGLDSRFVVAAPQGIDDAMIVSPGGQAAAPALPDVWVVPDP